MNERGEIITTILIALIAVGILVGGFLSVWDVKCDKTVQKCLGAPYEQDYIRQIQ